MYPYMSMKIKIKLIYHKWETQFSNKMLIKGHKL